MSAVGLIRAGFVMSVVCPVYPNEPTSSESGGWSQKCQEQPLLHGLDKLPLGLWESHIE